jgi:hypothetical protein
MRNSYLLIGLCAWCLASCAGEQKAPEAPTTTEQPSLTEQPSSDVSPARPDLKPHLISDFEAVESLDDVGPGGWEAAEGSRWYVSKLSDCSQNVLSTTLAWAEAQSLAVLRESVEPSRTQVFIAGPQGATGYYEVLYRFERERPSAKVSFTYFDRAGAPVESQTTNPACTHLVVKLRESLRCTAK